MTRRVLLAECKQEVSTFNPNLSRLADFGIRTGQAFLDYHRTVRNEVGGALSVLESEPSIELVPTYSAFFITSGGTLAQTDWETIARDFLDGIRNARDSGAIDGIYFCMHGAMCAQNEFDPEGFLLEQTRQILGEEVPIVVSLDLHGIATRKMFRHSDAIVAYHTYPHVDFYETGVRAARLLLNIMHRRVRPVTARVPIPALVRGDELITETGLFGRCIQQAKEIEQGPRGLSAGMFIGNPFTDVPELGTYSFVVTDNDEALARTAAVEIARQFWGYHEHMQVPLISLHEMQETVMRLPKSGTIALVDAADATSSGASGDSNAVLKALMQCGYSGCTLIPIVDRPAVDIAMRAGIGAEVTVSLGGTLDPTRFEPIEIRARVKSISDGVFRSESFGELWNSGPTAVLQSGTFTIVAGSRAVNLYDRSFFYANGQNPKNFDAVVVKSPHCQHSMYAAWCSHMLLIDAPGSSSANVSMLGHRRCQRPIFPLDDIQDYEPTVEIYRRKP
ncbi:MAG: M81 family metallopeptidase [Planctomycetes bacterium]|nr:M81 family metallopeptidase [Planctomycetota bacterium]